MRSVFEPSDEREGAIADDSADTLDEVERPGVARRSPAAEAAAAHSGPGGRASNTAPREQSEGTARLRRKRDPNGVAYDDTAAVEAGPDGFYNSHNGNDAARREARRRQLARKSREAAEADRPSPHDVPLDALLELTRTLQAEEDRREQAERVAAAAREAEACVKRNERWAEVKARLTARSSMTPMASLRSAEWDDDDDSGAEVSDVEERGYVYTSAGADRVSVRGRSRGAAVPMPDDPLIDPANGEERPMRRLVKYEKLPWSVELWHTVYNWFRWSLLAMFNFSDVAQDPSGYYQKRKFD